MTATLTGETSSFLVRLYPTEGGVWCVHIEGASVNQDHVLVPATFVLNIWRTNDARILRGTIQLHGSPHSAPVQANAQLLDLLAAWLDAA